MALLGLSLANLFVQFLASRESPLCIDESLRFTDRCWISAHMRPKRETTPGQDFDLPPLLNVFMPRCAESSPHEYELLVTLWAALNGHSKRLRWLTTRNSSAQPCRPLLLHDCIGPFESLATPEAGELHLVSIAFGIHVAGPLALTMRMSHEEEPVNGTRNRNKPDRAPPHWLNPLVRRLAGGAARIYRCRVPSAPRR
jgi:hypothetical protein